MFGVSLAMVTVTSVALLEEQEFSVSAMGGSYDYYHAIASLGAVDHLRVGLEGFGRPDGYLERQVSRWRGQLES